MHHLVNKDAKKMIPVSSAPGLDWGPPLIPLGLGQSGICARERKPQPEVMARQLVNPRETAESQVVCFSKHPIP